MSEYEAMPPRHCDHCNAVRFSNRCFFCKGLTRDLDEPPIDYDRLREDRNERRRESL